MTLQRYLKLPATDHGAEERRNSSTSTMYPVPSGYQYGELTARMPPTPPSNFLDFQHDDLSKSPQSLADKSNNHHMPIKLPIRTIAHHRSPPTPDTTPPRGLEVFGRASSSKQLNNVSSRTESFTTAREQPFASEVDISTPYTDTRVTPRAESMNEEDISSTSIEDDSVADTETGVDTNLVTSWDPRSATNNDNPQEKVYADRIRPSSRQDHSLKPDSSMNPVNRSPVPYTRSKDKGPLRINSLHQSQGYGNSSDINISPVASAFSRGHDSPASSAEIGRKFEKRLQDEDLKRMSASSAASSIVQAVVVDASPRQRHSLRHAGKNLAYRSFSERPLKTVSADNSPSELRPFHRLSHKNERIFQRGSDIYRELSPLQSLEKRAAYQSLRGQEAGFSRKPYGAVDRNINTHGRAEEKDFKDTFNDRQFRHLSAPERFAAGPNTTGVGGYQRPQQVDNVGDASRAGAYKELTTDYTQRPARKPVPSRAGNYPNGLVEKHINVANSIQREEHGNIYLPESGAQKEKLPFIHAPALVTETRLAQDATMRIGNGSSLLNVTTSLRNSQASASSSERQQIEDATRNGLMRSGSTSYRLEPRRMSSDRFSSRVEDHAMARHMYAQGTPFSHVTDSQDALEVSEATAVSIFPHNNHSLLVVQQMTRPHLAARGEASGSLAQPHILFQSATPPAELTPEPIPDTSLENPRKPPEPPAFQVIPPTPCQEADNELAPQTVPEKQPSLPRPLSLVKRARRYSDSLLQPVLAQALPRRRVASQQDPKSRTADEAQKNKLHPFWRPRGFWDDFESDEELDDDDDRLPPGGDTSDVVVDEKPKRRLTLRNTGGFLIGNTLGVTRAGTNVRRPHISLPARLAAQRQSREDVDAGNAKTGSLSLHSGSGFSNSEIVLNRLPRKIYKIPGVRLDVQFIGLRGMRHVMMARRRRRELRRNEERRERLRQRIGPRVSVE